METYEGREPYIFISYARADSDKVTPFLEALSNAGYRFWYDRSTQGGADWLEVLLGKVAACEVFCPLFSEAFKNSHYCYEETEWAYQQRKTIVPVYLETLTPDGLRLFYQRLLQSRQTLRLYDCANAAEFVDGLGREQAFTPCKAAEWNKTGQIQWRFTESDGVLTIAQNEDLLGFFKYGSIPPYQFDLIHRGSTAPWMSHREQILSVEIADDIDEIGNYAFFACKCLTNVRIGNSVRQIGDFAFYRCASLTDVCIPDSVTEIGDSAFEWCYSLTNVRIPDGVTKIDNFTFCGCERLITVRIPDSVTEIGTRAFCNCEHLIDVRIGDSVTQIGDFAFAFCERLTSVEIPAGATFAESSSFPSFPKHTRVIRRAAPEQSQ